MPIKYHGRREATSQGYIDAVPGNAYATVLDPMPENGWVTTIYAHMGKQPVTGTPTARLSLYDTAASAPDDKTADTNRITPSAVMDGGGSGDLYSASVNWTGGGTGSPLDTAMKARSGVRFAGTCNVQGSGLLAIGEQFAEFATNENRNLYIDNAVGSTPPTTFDVDVSAYEGQLAIALGYWANTKPVATYTGDTGNITTGTPTLSGTFTDAESVYGDRMTAYQVQVRNKTTNVLLWDTGILEADSSTGFSIDYAGAAISPGDIIQAQIRVFDEFDTSSNWTSWASAEMTYLVAGTVTATAPTGKQLAVTGLTFGGTYKHVNMLAATHVKVKIKRNGSAYYESASIVKAIAAPGSPTAGVAFTLSQASLSPALTLPWGGSFTLQIAAQDSTGQWSDYSPSIAFTTDAYPTIPSGITPGNNVVVTTYPQISFVASDPDNLVTALTGYVRIFGPMLITNGAFPSNVTGWTAAALAGQTKTFTFDGADGRLALGSGKIAITASTAAAGTFFATENDTHFPVVVGQSYTGRISVKTSNANITPRARINWYNALDVSVSVSVEDDYTPTINVWSDRSVTGIAPVGAVYAKVTARIYNDTANQIGNVWLDDASMDSGYRYIRTATYNATKGRFEYQITSTDFDQFATYLVSAAASDGTLTSAYSTPESIIYADGPQVSFVRPVDGATVLTTRTRMTWQIDSGDQAQYKLEIFDDSMVHIWDSGWLASTSVRDFQVPDSRTNNIVDNLNWYYARIHIKNALGIEGTATSHFYVEFPPVRTLDLSAILTPAKFDSPYAPTTVLLTFPQTDYPSSQFEEYRITKRLASETPGQAITIWRSSSPSDTRVLDDNVRSGGTEYIYALTQLVTRDGDASRSERIEASVIVDFKEIIVNDAQFSGDFRCVVRTWSDFHSANAVIGVEEVPFGESKPMITFSGANYDTITFTAQFIDDDYGTGLEYKTALNQLRDRMQPVMIRHPRGDYWFASIISVEWDYSLGQIYVASFKAVQNNYVEGPIQ